MRRLAIAVAVLAACGAASTAPIAIKAEGSGLVAPALVRLRVTVAPNRDNRGLWIAIEATGFAAAHYEQLEGAKAPITRWVEFKAVPGGEYGAFARLLRTHGETTAADAFIVEGEGADPDDPADPNNYR